MFLLNSKILLLNVSTLLTNIIQMPGVLIVEERTLSCVVML